MAAMTTVLTEFAQNGNSRTCTLPNHTVLKPELLIEKRKVPATNTALAEFGCRTLVATSDADGNVLASKVSVETVVRYPVNGQAADVDIAVAYHRDILAGDEFKASVDSQNWLS
jgi:hypothetical protein